MNEARIGLYRRLLEARELISQVLYARGVPDDVMQAALDAGDANLSEAERREDMYLSALGHFVVALGGRLEVRAVFDGESVLVRQAPGTLRQRR